MRLRLSALTGPLLTGLFLLTLAQASLAQVAERNTSQPVPTAQANKIEVVEVFGYWCIHCAQFRQQLEDWAEAQPDDVVLKLIPAVFSGGVEDELARAFYAAEAMAVLDKVHAPLFNAVAVERRVRDREGILATVAGAGVDREQFAATMDSFSVRSKANQAKSLMPRYGVGVTPSLIIEGKTILEPSTGGFDALLRRAEALIADARQSRSTAEPTP